jgi:hypothetical protein
MRYPKILPLLAAALLFAHPTPAQEPAGDRLYTNTLSIQPLYLLNQGIRIDYDRQIATPAHWLQISAKAYPKTEAPLFDDDRIEDVSGLGTEINYKYFFLKQHIPYLMAGISWNYYHAHLYGYDYHPFSRDELTFYYPGYTLQTQNFNKAALNACFGIQTSPWKRFFIDGYIGIGYSRSLFDQTKTSCYPISGNMNAITYTGLTLNTGLRLGLRF